MLYSVPQLLDGGHMTKCLVNFKTYCVLTLLEVSQLIHKAAIALLEVSQLIHKAAIALLEVSQLIHKAAITLLEVSQLIHKTVIASDTQGHHRFACQWEYGNETTTTRLCALCSGNETTSVLYLVFWE